MNDKATPLTDEEKRSLAQELLRLQRLGVLPAFLEPAPQEGAEAQQAPALASPEPLPGGEDTR